MLNTAEKAAKRNKKNNGQEPTSNDVTDENHLQSLRHQGEREQTPNEAADEQYPQLLEEIRKLHPLTQALNMW